LERGLPEGADLLSVNFPWGCTRQSPRRFTRLGRVGYGQVFQPAPEEPAEEGVHYRHDFGGMIRREASLQDTDLAAARGGIVSLTPARLAHAADVTDAERNAWERDG
jgi:broad specificity polyphosphatase/5'/3'-nucleotidase SurE